MASVEAFCFLLILLIFLIKIILYITNSLVVSVVYLCHNFFCGTLSDQYSPAFIFKHQLIRFCLRSNHSIMDHLISLPVSNMAGIGGFPCNICSFVTDQHIFFLQDYFRKQKLFHCMYQKLIKYKKHETALFFFTTWAPISFLSDPSPMAHRWVPR